MSSYQWPITKPTFFDLAVYCIPLRFGNSAWDFWGAKSWSRDFFGFCWKKKKCFPFILFSYQSFSLSYLELQTIFPCSDIGPATATLDPRPRHWTRDRAIGPRPRHWTPDRDIGKISDTKITSSYTALSHNFPTNKKSKLSFSNKCNKIFGQSRREMFWTPNKSDPWGQNTPFCQYIRRRLNQ